MARSRSGRRLERLCHPHELVAAQRARNDEQQASVPVSCPTAGFVVVGGVVAERPAQGDPARVAARRPTYAETSSDRRNARHRLSVLVTRGTIEEGGEVDVTAFVVLAFLVLIGPLSYFYGVDSRRLDDRGWVGSKRR
jgi:hypothetical protein